jgi:hypothetical protein
MHISCLLVISVVKESSPKGWKTMGYVECAVLEGGLFETGFFVL